MPTNTAIEKDTIGMSPLNSARAETLLKDMLRTQPWIETNLISVKIDSSRVILTGCVYSAAERDQVQAAAVRLPGVTEVDNQIGLIKEQRTKNG